MAAEVLARGGVSVTVLERMPTVGRKLLMAGRGGLNLTHTEPSPRFRERYGAAAPMLASALEAFPPKALREWAHGLGQPTVVGSSGRVFPQAWKASPLLRAWLGRLRDLGVAILPGRSWTGFGRGTSLRFAGPPADDLVQADAVVLALGGASWPRLGADGSWVGPLVESGVEVRPLRPANAGLLLAWSEPFRERFAGAPLKRVRLRVGAASVIGEPVVTEVGLEGGAVYGIFTVVREALASSGAPVRVSVDLRPDLSVDALEERLRGGRARDSFSSRLRRTAGLDAVAVALLREARPHLPRDSAELAMLIKAVPLIVIGTAGLERAISTAGGIAWSALDDRLMLRARPGVFAAGEMLDWEAPTGGYLLQACLATGVAAGRGALDWLAAQRRISVPAP